MCKRISRRSNPETVRKLPVRIYANLRRFTLQKLFKRIGLRGISEGFLKFVNTSRD